MELIRVIYLFICYIGIVNGKSKDSSLTARDLLNTIAPTNKHIRLPPGFPNLNDIRTDKFDYRTTTDKVRVSAALEKPIVIFPDYLTVSNIKMNFTFNKKRRKNRTWGIKVRGSLAIGSTIFHVNLTPNGRITAFEESLELHDLCSEFLKAELEAKKDIGIDVSAFTLENVTLNGILLRNMNGMELTFGGTLNIKSLQPIQVKIHINKYEDSAIQFFSVFEFYNVKPEIVLRKILNQKTLNVPFLAHMLSDSNLFSTNKDVFGVAFTYNEIYYYRESSYTGGIITSVLQSHIPEGVSLYFPIKVTSSRVYTETTKIAFVINKPAFDLLIDQNDKLSVNQVLSVLSKEFAAAPEKTIPNFVTELDDAFTSHISFDSNSNMFSIFVRLHEYIELVPKLLKIKVTNLVLQRRVGTDNAKEKWKVSAKGIYKIGKSKVYVQYSELSDERKKPYGLTGYGLKLNLQDIIEEYQPEFFPDPMSKKMIDNTEIENLNIHSLRLFSRVPKDGGTPHVLITGYTDLPAWEKNIQIALLILRMENGWKVKWATSLKQSPLSNIIQALTGFDSRDIKLLHNSHIMTTIISSPLPSYSLLPRHIITTPLLRLPVKKALTIIALLRFPDNCGDDKMCQSASQLLDIRKIYTAKGVLSLNEFPLTARINHNIKLGNNLAATKNSLLFVIGNNSRFQIKTSLKLPDTNLTFDGLIHIEKSGDVSLDFYLRQKRWASPFNFPTLSFEEVKIRQEYIPEKGISVLQMTGVIKLGAQGNRAELEADLDLTYSPNDIYFSKFNANFTDITLTELLGAFTIDIQLPEILQESRFPSGLTLTYNGKGLKNSTYELKGQIKIFGRLLSCNIIIIHPNTIQIVTENSPAPVIFAKGQIIVQQDANSRLRGPKIIANIDHLKANVVAKGYVKVLGIESDVLIALHNKDIRFSVAGRLMEFKQTKLSAYSAGSTDSFQVYGCLEDVAFQVQILLIEIITRSANQSIENMEKAEENYLNAQKYYELADEEEADVRKQRDRARAYYEELLIDYGRAEVRVNDSCIAPKCGMKCFGCPRLNKCCRLDIFGHCIACSTWKSCCWKNIDPICIAKYDGCHVIRSLAEKDLAEREALIMQQKIILDNLEQHVTNSEINKGKHKAVLEAAIDAKQVVAEDSSAGLNAHDAIKNFGFPYGWAKINSVCYNASMEQAATGCMDFEVASELFRQPEKNITIWSCLKEDLVTELTESLANYIFPNIIDTSSDSVSEVTANLNNALLDQSKQKTGAQIDNIQCTDLDTQNGCNQGTALDNKIIDLTNSKPVAGAQLDIGAEINLTPPNEQLNPSNNPVTYNAGGLNSNGPIITPNAPMNTPPIITPNAPLDIPPNLPPVIIEDNGKVQPSIMISNNTGNKVLETDFPMPLIPEEQQSQSEQTNPIKDFPIFGVPLPESSNNVDWPSFDSILNPSKTDNLTFSINITNPVPTENETQSTNINGEDSLDDDDEIPQQLPVKLLSVQKVNGFKDYSGSASGSAEGSTTEIPMNLSPIDLELKNLLNTEMNINKLKKKAKKIKKENDNQNKNKDVSEENEISLAEHIVETEVDEQGKPNLNKNKSHETENNGKIGNNSTFLKQHKKKHQKHNSALIKQTILYPGNDNALINAQNIQPGIISVNQTAQNPIYEGKQAIYYGDNRYPSFNHNFNKKLKWKSNRKVSYGPLDDMFRRHHGFGFFHDQQNKQKKKRKKRKHKKRHDKRTKLIPEHLSKQYIDNNILDDIAKTVKETKQQIHYPNYLATYRKFPGYKPHKDPKWVSKMKEEGQNKLGNHSDLDTSSSILKTPGFSYETVQKEDKKAKHRDKRNLKDILFFDQPYNSEREKLSSIATASPFWDVKTYQRAKVQRSTIPLKPSQQRLMSGMMRKRWKIPDNSSGRCHIFHQLISICKDMAETIVLLDKSLKTARNKFRDEDKETYMELYDTEEFLLNSAKQANLSNNAMNQAEKTLAVVRQGVNIWSKRCTNEFEWQNQSGVQTWLQAMDLRIQELGGFGVYRFLENLFHAFEALFEALTYSDANAAKNALDMLQRIREISNSFDKVFKKKLSVSRSRPHADQIVAELNKLRKESMFC